MIYFFLVLILVLSFIIFRFWWKDVSAKQLRNERFERGNFKEEEAKELLEKWGYTIIDSQKRYMHTFTFGGEELSIPIVIDYLVSKNDKTYVIEVKSGTSAIDIYNSNTRRQILEYYHAVQADGFYLLNMEKREMKKVVFSSVNNAVES